MKQVDPYEELNINAYGVLKPPLVLLLIMLIETWHFWSSVLTLFSGQTWLFSSGAGWISFAVEVPSLLVLTALGARAPGANRIFRTIWHRGRELLTVAAVGNLTIVIAAAIQDPTWRLNSDWSSVLVAFLHIWALARIWMSAIIEKVFLEFPDQIPGEKNE
jgi:hypothetical protein